MALNLDEELYDVNARLREIEEMCSDSDDDEADNEPSVVKYEPVGVVTTFKEEPVIYEEVQAVDSENVVLTTTTGGDEELASYQFIRVPIQDVVVETADTQQTDVNSHEIPKFIIPDTEKVQIVTNSTRKKKTTAPNVSKRTKSSKSKVEITSDNESVSKNRQPETTNVKRRGRQRKSKPKLRDHMDEEDRDRAANEARGYSISRKPEPRGKTKSTYHCLDCDFKVTFNSGILDHVNAEHRRIPLECTECDYVTFKWKALSGHRLKKHKLLGMKCPECNFKGSVLWQLRQHMEEKHEGVWVDGFEAEYSTPDKRPPHAETIPKQRGKVCPYAEHYDIYTEPGITWKDKYRGRKYRCRKCDHECSQRNNMMVHLNSAHFKQTLSCPWCEFTSLNAITLESHVRQKHEYKKRQCMVPGCYYHSVEEGRFQEHLLKKHGAVYDESDHSIKIYS